MTSNFQKILRIGFSSYNNNKTSLCMRHIHNGFYNRYNSIIKNGNKFIRYQTGHGFPSSNQGYSVNNYRAVGASHGLTFGTTLAIVISYSNYGSVLWACIHGFFSWFYVGYYVITNPQRI